MMINIALLMVFLVCLAALGLTLRRIEQDFQSRRRAIHKLESERNQLHGGCETLQEMVRQADAALSDAVAALEQAKTAREEAEVELKLAQDAPKRRLFVTDKSALIHGRLWEVTVANDMPARAGGSSPIAGEWATGRTFLIGSATDRDARFRLESRFPSSQGYRIMKVERFRRAS